LHDEELHNLYASQNIIRVIKLGRIRWVEHVAHIEEMRNVYSVLGNLKGRDHVGDSGIDKRIIYKRLSHRYRM